MLHANWAENVLKKSCNHHALHATGEEWSQPATSTQVGVSDMGTTWASLGIVAQYVLQYNGRCAYLQLSQNHFSSNYAALAGAVIYATDSDSINITCKTSDNSSASLTCDESIWANNSVGMLGYGPTIAFPPAVLNTSLPAKLTYVSNGVDKLPITLHALDQRGTMVTSGMAVLLSR